MAITIKDIAKVCDTSYSTVSRVLNNNYKKKTKKVERIIETAKSLGYKPNNLAVHLVKRISNMLGLLIPDVANPHYSEITKCIQDAAFDAGYQLFLCNTDWDVRKEVLYRNSLLGQRVAGMIVLPVCDNSHELFSNMQIPVVLFGSRTEETTLNNVVMDNVKAGTLATEHLINNGYKDLVFISRKLINYTVTDRILGFSQALQKNNLTFDKESVITSINHKWHGSYQAMKEFLEKNRIPDGVVAYNDFIAFGAMQALEEYGFSVGHNIGIVGFDDISFSSLSIFELSTITPKNEILATEAIKIIKQKINSNKTKSDPISTVLEPFLVKRNSSKKD